MQGLYIEYHGWIEAWLRRQIGCAYHAQDLAQDTFEQVLRASPALQLEQLREPRAYLVTIARRVLINHWRRRDLERAYAEAVQTFGDDLVPSAEERVAVLQALACVDAVLQALPRRARQVFFHNQLDGMTYPQIAEAMGLSAVSVRRAMKQAITAVVAAF